MKLKTSFNMVSAIHPKFLPINKPSEPDLSAPAKKEESIAKKD